MQPIKKILYSFMWCKSYIETQKRWNIFKDFIACFLLEKQGYPHSPYCTNRKNQVRVNMHWFISQLHRNICYHFLPAFVNFTPCSITPSDQILFLSFFTVICNVHSFFKSLHIVQTGKTRCGWTCIDLFHNSTWRSVVIFYQHLWISRLVQPHHLNKKKLCHFLLSYATSTAFQSHNVTGKNARPIRGFHCT